MCVRVLARAPAWAPGPCTSLLFKAKALQWCLFFSFKFWTSHTCLCLYIQPVHSYSARYLRFVSYVPWGKHYLALTSPVQCVDQHFSVSHMETIDLHFYCKINISLRIRKLKLKRHPFFLLVCSPFSERKGPHFALSVRGRKLVPISFLSYPEDRRIGK